MAVNVATTDTDNIRHLQQCPGCPECDRLMEFYATCDHCHEWGHKSTMTAIVELKTNEMIALCENCKPRKAHTND